MISIKDGVSISGMRPEIGVAIQIVDQCLKEAARSDHFETVITSCTDGVHGRGSLHYVGLGVDFRSKTLAPGQKTAAVRKAKKRLGKEFDFILESEGEPEEHFHLEFQPK